jgi:hypothetical protein
VDDAVWRIGAVDREDRVPAVGHEILVGVAEEAVDGVEVGKREVGGLARGRVGADGCGRGPRRQHVHRPLRTPGAKTSRRSRGAAARSACPASVGGEDASQAQSSVKAAAPRRARVIGTLAGTGKPGRLGSDASGFCHARCVSATRSSRTHAWTERLIPGFCTGCAGNTARTSPAHRFVALFIAARLRTMSVAGTLAREISPMTCHSTAPWSRTGHTALLALFGLLAACERGSAPFDPAHTVPAANVAQTTAPLQFTVRGPDERTPVAGATVRIYGLRQDGTLGDVATGLTDGQGIAIFDLDPADYCATVRTSPTEWLGLTIVVPATPFAYTQGGPAFAPMTRGLRAYRPFTPATFEDCWTRLPIQHAAPLTHERVIMQDPFTVNATVLDPNGQPLSGVDVYAVIPVDVPWRPANLDPEILTGFFSYVDRTASPASVVVGPGGPYALEFQGLFQGFNLTASLKGQAGQSGGTDIVVLQAEPLVCTLPTIVQDAGQPGIDFLQAAYGYHADLALNADLTIMALQLKLQGGGPATVRVRTDIAGVARHVNTVAFECVNGDCFFIREQETANNPQHVQLFSQNLGGGLAKVTLVVLGIPTPHDHVFFQATAANDRVPLAPQTWVRLTQPTRCSVQQSNDDKWYVGEI